MHHVGQQQLLVLLLVGQAETEETDEFGVRIAQERADRLVDVGAVGADLGRGRPGHQAPGGTRMPLAEALIVRVEQVVEVVVERGEVRQAAAQDEALEEPGRVGAMPFGRARIVHRLDRLILRRQVRTDELGACPDIVVGARGGARECR